MQLFKKVPFLNGGLFECLDRIVAPDEFERHKSLEQRVVVEGPHKVLRIDGFSERVENPLHVPNKLFFSKEAIVKPTGLIEALNDKPFKAKGLIELFQDYKFTVEENTPDDQEVALDPELLGKVFENLLASYNIDTQSSARKKSGSFYTPRVVVDYMVDEALIDYFERHLNQELNQPSRQKPVPLPLDLVMPGEFDLTGAKQVSILASEFITTNGARIDTLGLDENGCPVILEYKRASNENVINQGLYYLDWLMDHRKDFQWLVLEKLGKKDADVVDWSAPRLICIAGDFNKYDDHAVRQIQRNIELIRYRRFGPELLMLDLVVANSVQGTFVDEKRTSSSDLGVSSSNKYKTIGKVIEQLDSTMIDRFEALRAYLNALGDDVQETILLFYIAFKRIKNFACVEFRPTTNKILLFVKVDPKSVTLEPGFTRDVSNLGHFGTGDLEITLTKPEDLERAMPLIKRSYEDS